MTLQLDVDALAAEEADETIDHAADAVALGVERLAAGERDEAARPAIEVLERERALAFRRAELHLRHQTAQIPVAIGVFAQHRQRVERMASATPQVRVRRALAKGELGADERPDSHGERRLMKARYAIDAVAVEQRDRPVAEIGRPIDQRFGQRGALKKAEGGSRMQLNVASSRHDDPVNRRWRR
jgi:hypothetical protein